MTAKVLRRSRAKFVSKQTVDEMGIALQELPEKVPDTLSLRQTIERLREPIEAALAKGYGYEELVPMLAQQGINIQPSTLKRYVLSGGDRANRKRATGKTRRPRKSEEEETAPATPAEAQLTADLTELAEAEAPAPTARKRGRAAASSDTAAKSASQDRSKSAAATKTRTSSTRGRRKAKA